MNVSGLLVLLTAYMFGTSVLLPAQAIQERPEPPVFGENIDVRLVNVEVVVTGRGGERIAGLAPGEFRLLVDGEEMEIAFFSEVREGRAVTESSEPAESISAPAPLPALPSSEASVPVGTRYLVFFDDSSLIGAKRDRVTSRLRTQLSALGPDDSLALVAFDGRELTVLQTWTADRSKQDAAFDRLRSRPAKGIEAYAELRRLATSFGKSFNAQQRAAMGRSHGSSASTHGSSGYEQYLVDNSQLFPEEVDAAMKSLERIEATVTAASAALRALEAPPGRKVLLLLAGDLPFSVGQYVASFTTKSAERVITDQRIPTGEELYRPLVETANLLGYTLYPVDAGGVTTLAADVEQESALQFQQLAALSDGENEVHFSLMHLADETGGKAILNTANVEALERVVVDTASYYWLGFYAPRAGDDAQHDIRVEVKRSGLQVRARKGYTDLSPAVERDLAVESALFLGPEGAGEELTVEVGEPKRKRGDRKRMMVPLNLMVPASALEFVARSEDGPWVAELDLRFAAVDVNGGRTDPLRVPVTLSLPRQPGPDTVIRYQAEVELRRVEQRVAVLLHDPATLRTLAGRVEVSPR